jgi:hypothetical protein
MRLLKFKSRVFKILKVTDHTITIALVNEADKGLIRLESEKIGPHINDMKDGPREKYIKEVKSTAYYTGDYSGEFSDCMIDGYDMNKMEATISYDKHYVYTSKEAVDKHFIFTEEEKNYGKSLTPISRYNL